MRVLGWGALLLLLATWSQVVRADVYQCSDGQGNKVYTSDTDGYRNCHKVSLGQLPKVSGTAKRGAGGSPVLKGSVYRVVRADGSIEYTNVAPGKRSGHKVTRLFTYIDVCAACAVHSSVNWKTVPLNVNAYGKAVRAAAKSNGVQPAFLRAIMHAESAFKPNALSAKGAQGLMQLMPATASSMGVVDAFDATQNIRGGARYLSKLLKQFHGDRSLVAAAYNAGPTAVRKYNGVPPYAETRVYVQRVDTLYKRYSKALGKLDLAGAEPGS